MTPEENHDAVRLGDTSGQASKAAADNPGAFDSPFETFRAEREGIAEWLVEHCNETDGTILVQCVKDHPECANYMVHLQTEGAVEEGYDLGQPDGDWTAELADFQTYLLHVKKTEWSIIDALKRARSAQTKAMQDWLFCATNSLWCA